MRSHGLPMLSPVFSDGIPIVVLGAAIFGLAFVIPRHFRVGRSRILPVGPASVAASGIAVVAWGLLTAAIIPREYHSLVIVLGFSVLFFGGVVDAFIAANDETRAIAEPPPKRRREKRRRPRRR